MPHHFPKATVQAAAWCNTCGRETPHYVFDGRLGRCMNEHPRGAVRANADPSAAPCACGRDEQDDSAQMEMFGGLPKL